jgi:uncharacterized protein
VKIHLPAYNKAVHQIEESLETAELLLDPELFLNPIRAHVTLDRHDPYLECKFQITATIHPVCDRCLESFESEVTAETPMLYVLGKEPSGGEIDDTDVMYVPVSTTDLDISKDIRDLLILSVSGRHICFDDCKGICPGCGSNLNLEPCKCNPKSS